MDKEEGKETPSKKACLGLSSEPVGQKYYIMMGELREKHIRALIVTSDDLATVKKNMQRFLDTWSGRITIQLQEPHIMEPGGDWYQVCQKQVATEWCSPTSRVLDPWKLILFGQFSSSDSISSVVLACSQEHPNETFESFPLRLVPYQDWKNVDLENEDIQRQNAQMMEPRHDIKTKMVEILTEKRKELDKLSKEVRECEKRLEEFDKTSLAKRIPEKGFHTASFLAGFQDVIRPSYAYAC